MKLSKEALEFKGDVYVFNTVNNKVVATVKVMTSYDEFRMVKAEFDTQSQCERLLPGIINQTRKVR